MLSYLIDEFYNKLAINFHRNASDYKSKEEIQCLSSNDLTTLEVVYLLDSPTYKELADFLKISTPNATYRINKLIEHNYLIKRQDQRDKRKYYLNVSDKFLNYYCINDAFIAAIGERARQRFGIKELEQFQTMLKIITEELME